MISAILVVLVILLLVLNTPKKPKNFPPGPPNLPIYGAFPILRAYGLRDLPKGCTKLCDVYKTKILGLFLSIFPCVVLNDAALLKEMLYREEFDGRLDIFVVRLRSYWKQLGIFFTDGYFWHTQRRFSLRYMRDYGFGRRSDTLEEVVANEIKEMVNGPKYAAEKTIVKEELVYVHFVAPFMNGLLHILTQTTLPRSEYHLLWELGRNGLVFLRNSDDFGGIIALTPTIRHVAPKLSGYKDMKESNQRLIDVFTTMAPDSSKDESLHPEVLEKLVAPQAGPRKYDVVLLNVILFGYWHLAAIYGLYLCFTSAKWSTILLNIFLYTIAELGMTAGAHRLWSHKAYKAKLPLQILLMVFTSIAFQNTVTDWVRDHRLHHKYSDTDADPHNAARGFFYSHVGWLLVRKHPEVKRRGKLIDLSDIHANPVLKFQKKYAIPLIGAVCFVLPTFIPVYFWEESLNNAWNICLLRYVMNLNITFLVNSAAHKFGNKPYEKNMLPAQNKFLSFIIFGEGFHNYHHVFPWDYRTAELGNNKLNWTSKFIDFFAWLGWAYDLKTVPQHIIQKRAQRTGDGTDLWGEKKKLLKEDEAFFNRKSETNILKNDDTSVL